MEIKIEESIGFHSWCVANSISQLISKNFRLNGLELPHSQFVILKILYENGAKTQQEIADFLFKDKSAVKRSLDILIKKELVTIESAGSGKYVHLTEKAVNYKEIIDITIEYTLKQATKGISPKKIDEIIKYMDKIYHNIKENL